MLAALASLLLLAACGDTAQTPIPAPTAAPQGGIYRIAGPYDAQTLDPARANGLEDAWLTGALLFSQLYAYDPNGVFTASLAAGLPAISSDKLTYTVPLRPMAKFHNGRTVTSADVKFTFERVADPATASWARTALDNIAAITTPADDRVQFQLHQPSAAFPTLLTLSALSIVPRNEVLVAGKQWGAQTVIGSGPFKLAEWKRGQSMRLERNPLYFQNGLPKLNGIEIAFNTVAPVALEKQQKNEADYVWFNPGATELNNSGARRTAPSLSTAQLWFNLRNADVADVRVRQAIAAAIDRNALASQVPNAHPANGLLPSLSPQFDAAFKLAHPFDVKHAAALLTQTNVTDQTPLTLATDASAASRAGAQKVADDLRTIGLNVTVVTGNAVEFADAIDSGLVALVYDTRRYDTPDAWAVFAPLAACDTTTPAPGCSVQAKAAVEQAEQLLMSDPERTALYRQVQDILVNKEVTVVPLLTLDYAGLGAATAIDPIYGLPALLTAQKSQ